MTGRVQVLSREGCHLCSEAMVIVADVCAAVGESFEVIDVDGDPVLRERHGDEVPVVIVDGEVVGFWRIQADAVRSALAK
jgi:hypothetical protein